QKQPAANVAFSMLCPLQSLDRCTSGAGRVRRTVFTCSKLRQPLFAPCEFSPAIIFRTLGYPPRKDQSSAGQPSRPPANFGGAALNTQPRPGRLEVLRL